MIARLTNTEFNQHARNAPDPSSPVDVGTAARVLSGLGGLADMIRKARLEMRVSRAEFGLLEVVVPQTDAKQLSLQNLNDWICRTSKKNREGNSDGL